MRGSGDWTDARRLLDRPVPDEVAAEWTAEAAEPKETSPLAQSVVVFRVGDEWFALRSTVFVSIQFYQAAHTVPRRTGKLFAGLVNVNGELWLCVSLAGALGIQEPAARDSRVRTCAIRCAGERYAFQADEVLGVRRIAESAFEPPPLTVARSASGQTSATVTVGELRVGLLDETKLFDMLGKALAW
jgi:chemotaxis-related protein WspD